MNTSKSKALARAVSFEHETNRQEKQMLRERRKRIKVGGFKSEGDYFRNVNPLTGKRAHHS